MSVAIESAAANGTVGHVPDGVPQTSSPAPKTILVVGLGMVGIGEHGRQNRHAVIYPVPIKRLSRNFST